jgi:hypothetical protein
MSVTSSACQSRATANNDARCNTSYFIIGSGARVRDGKSHDPDRTEKHSEKIFSPNKAPSRSADHDQAAALAGRLSVEWDRLQKIKADQEREPEEPLEILPEEWRSAEPEPSLELEDAAPGDPSEAPEKKDQDPSGEFLREVPEFRMPVAAGLDDEGD